MNPQLDGPTPEYVKHKALAGFSLVELSLVLVILGLLVGTILSGQSMIRAAELRKLKTSTDKFITAGMAFRDKYQCLPGDCSTFTNFFPTSPNGNGSGKIGGMPDGSSSDAGDSSPYTFTEQIIAWNHLSRAGLIEGSYSGTVTALTGTNVLVGTDAPASGLGANGFFLIVTQGPIQSDYAYKPKGNYGNIIMPVTMRGNYQFDNIGAAMTQQEMWNIDNKYDDGKPLTGIIRAGLGQNYTIAAAAYDLDLPDTFNLNHFIFITGF